MDVDVQQVVDRLSAEVGRATVRAVVAEARVAQLEEQLMKMEVDGG